MLVVKVYIGGGSVLRQIDEVHIQNVTDIDKMYNKTHEYKIRKPNVSEHTIKHIRKDGYKPLVIKALKLLKGV